MRKAYHWQAIVAFDDVEPTISSYYNIKAIRTPTKLGFGVNSAGQVRNFAVDQLSKSYGSSLASIEEMYYIVQPWVGFVDDDDTLSEFYLQIFEETRSNNKEVDLIIFRMQYEDKSVLPPPGFIGEIKELENKVGISFACSLKLFNMLGGFKPSSGEDFDFLKRAEEAGAKIKLVDEIGYYVAPLGCPPDRRK